MGTFSTSAAVDRASPWASVRECHQKRWRRSAPAASRTNGGRFPNAFRACRSLWHDAVVDASRIAPFLSLADLPAEELDELAAALSEVEVEAGATAVTVDDYGTAIYFIEQGNADVLNEGGETTNALGPGDTFGEIGLLLTGERTATVLARTPMRLISLSGQDFDRIRARVPGVERSLRRLGTERADR